MRIVFDTSEADMREAQKARRRRRYEERTGAVHQRRNAKNRPAEAGDANTKRGAAANREATNRGNW